MKWNIDTGTVGRSRIVVEGDCDLYEAPAFTRAVIALIGGGERDLQLDFSGVGYLDSTGVGSIIKILQTARRLGVKIRFSGFAGSPRKVLSMAGILPLLGEAEGEGARP